MTLFTSLFIYAGLGFFLAGSLWRVIHYSRMPVHLRWELYPVPGEGAKRAEHGGSYFEESNWWKSPRKKHPFNELRAMLAEIFLLRGVWTFNRPLWWFSFPFHTGLYLIVAGCFFSGWGVVFAAHSFAPALFLAARLCSWFGLSLALVGSVGLLLRRIFDQELRNYTVPGDLFNVGGFALSCGLILAGSLTGTMPSLRETVVGLLTFRSGLHLPLLASLGIVLGSAMTGYIPYTHMAHFIAKYFTYHAVRWDDAEKTASMEVHIGKCLAYHPTWSASHIHGEGKKTWAEIATSNPAGTERTKQ